MVIITRTMTHLKDIFLALSKSAKNIGLIINSGKREYLNVKKLNITNETICIHVEF